MCSKFYLGHYYYYFLNSRESTAMKYTSETRNFSHMSSLLKVQRYAILQKISYHIEEIPCYAFFFPNDSKTPHCQDPYNFVHSQLLSHVRLCDPHGLACQAPLSVGFPRPEYCHRMPFPTPRDLPKPGLKPTPLQSP